eukprot:CAMPEP_0114981666 /NCGR_PEP_ID=MMETSP0216-20121206/5665_1 /TAXON_ID=223996 /ORGANISM="Protocruzia adherens, Strain Boccale" /LENGTH=334 /DNA_ID=CAMNT_0002343351 /DNA_START=214 /DNA_END=1218 /DNA_ORIENTATION=+
MGKPPGDDSKPLKPPKQPNYVRIIVTAVFLTLTLYVFTAEFNRLYEKSQTYLSWDDSISVGEKESEVDLFQYFEPSNFNSTLFYREHLFENTSCLIHKFAADWPACNKWTKDYILSTLDDIDVDVKYHANSMQADPAVNWKQMKFPQYSEFVQMKSKDPEMEEVVVAVDTNMPEPLLADLGSLDFANVLGEPEIKLFHSTNYRELHGSYSEKERIFVCLSDVMTIYAVPALDWANIEPTRLKDGTIWSKEDIRRSTRKSTTKFANVRSRVAILLLKGDVIYIPSWWWVSVQTQKIVEGAAMAVYEYPPASRMTNLLLQMLPTHFVHPLDEVEDD